MLKRKVWGYALSSTGSWLFSFGKEVMKLDAEF